MATGTFDPNVIVPSLSSITVGTSSAALANSASLAVKFVLTNTGTNPIYIGDSSVSASKYTAKITSGTYYTLDVQKIYHNRDLSYDLNRFYAVATASNQTLVLTLYKRGSSGVL